MRKEEKDKKLEENKNRKNKRGKYKQTLERYRVTDWELTRHKLYTR